MKSVPPPFRALRVLSAVVLLLAASPARAAIEGSPHDLIAQGYDVVKTSAGVDRCGRCHLPSATGTEGLLPAVPASLAEAWSGSSLTCFSCHDGTTIVSREVDASMTAFHPGAHNGKPLAARPGETERPEDLPAESGNRMGCVTCHDTHSSGRRPLLRVDLGKLCARCHADRAELGRGKENRTGNHLLTVGTVAPPPESPIEIGAGFRTPFPAPYPLQAAKTTAGVHWDLGGHLSEGAEGVIGCETCHAVHGGEEAAPLASLLSVDPVLEVADLFCEGCHAGVRGDGGGRSDAKPNPGGTVAGRTYHPVDDDDANGTGRIVEIKEPPGWPFGSKGSPRPLLCTSCHRAHGAQPGAMLLRKPAAGGAFCAECHESVPDFHHPAPGAWTGPCAAGVPTAPVDDWARSSCGFCHRAHNAGLGAAREADFVPVLREPAGSTLGCSSCHPDGNPTCSTRPAYQASHFLGDPTLPETYFDSTPPLRTTLWPESQLYSGYGGESAQVVTCLSCHAFRKGTLLTGDRGTARSLLARSGNPVEWTTDEGVYLCTGCHTANPGTGTEKKGHSHPTMNADVKKLGDAGPLPPASATVNGRVNCDSCHRPHEAATGGGYYILETVTADNTDPRTIHPRIDYTVVCHGCHEPGEY